MSILIKLHQRQILELELIQECEKRRYEISRKIALEEKKNVIEAYLFTSKTEYQRKYDKLLKIKQRLYTWYWQTLNKIMYYSNK
jgi:hypothetical protein